MLSDAFLQNNVKISKYNRRVHAQILSLCWHLPMHFCFQQRPIIIIPYRTKIRRPKLSKFRLVVGNFVRRKFCPIFQYQIQEKIGQNCRNFGLLSKILSHKIFCPTKFCPIRYFIRGGGGNFVLHPKVILITMICVKVHKKVRCARYIFFSILSTKLAL